MRILVLLAIGLLLYLVISSLVKKARNEEKQIETEKMVSCEKCGVHIVEEEAIQWQHHHFCCSEHLEDFRKSQ